MRLSSAIVVVSCASCTEGEEGTAAEDEAPFTALFHAERLGRPEPLQVGVLPQGAVLADDPDAFVAGGPTGEPMTVDEGDWSAQAGRAYEEDGFFEGQAFHVADDGSWWIAPPLHFTASAGATLEHTFALNFLAAGWWECCSYASTEVTVCMLGNIYYRDGRLAELPLLGEVEVTGMSFTGTRESGDTTEGQFLGADAASATVTRSDGSTYPMECCRGSCP
jgi:hypothetical protein